MAWKKNRRTYESMKLYKKQQPVNISKRKKKSKAVVKYNYLPPLNGFPKSKLVRLRWVENVVLNPTTGALAVSYFAANAMTDITGSSSGHQPRGFDQQMVGYEHYTVVGSKITARIVPQIVAQVSNTQTPYVWGIATLPTASITGITSPEEMIETRLGGTSFRLAGANQAFGASQVSPSLTRKFSSKKFFTSKAIVGDSQYEGGTSYNPSELAHYALWGGPSGGASVDPDPQNFIVTIDYLAVLTEPRVQPGS